MKIQMLVICGCYWNFCTILSNTPFSDEDKSAARAVAVGIWTTTEMLLLNIQMCSPCLLTSLMFLWEWMAGVIQRDPKGNATNSGGLCSPRVFKWLAILHFVKSVWILWSTFSLKLPIVPVSPRLPHCCCSHLHYVAPLWDIWIKFSSSLLFC